MNEDFAAFFASLNARRVEFLVIGGVAYNFYAAPRSTKDIDLWIRPTVTNLRRLVAALADFGVEVAELDVHDLVGNPRVLVLGRAPVRIDLLLRPAGLSWRTAWSRRVRSTYGRHAIGLVALQDLIASKVAAGRPRDLADVAMLRRVAARARVKTRRSPRRRP